MDNEQLNHFSAVICVSRFFCGGMFGAVCARLDLQMGATQVRDDPTQQREREGERVHQQKCNEMSLSFPSADFSSTPTDV
jgi:hypothetical protein